MLTVYFRYNRLIICGEHIGGIDALILGLVEEICSNTAMIITAHSYIVKIRALLGAVHI